MIENFAGIKARAIAVGQVVVPVIKLKVGEVTKLVDDVARNLTKKVEEPSILEDIEVAQKTKPLEVFEEIETQNAQTMCDELNQLLRNWQFTINTRKDDFGSGLATARNEVREIINAYDKKFN